MPFKRRGILSWSGVLFGAFFASLAFSSLLPEYPPYQKIHHLSAKKDFSHKTGKKGFRGREVDYKQHREGYLLNNLKSPLHLEPGIYRATFHARRGHHPTKGLLQKATLLFRIEIWDVTLKEKITSRELHWSDFGLPNTYEPRWVEFSMENRKGHRIEPRVYWSGLGNGEVSHVVFDRFEKISAKKLYSKAAELGEILEKHHLENGYVVSRHHDGRPDEMGDATTYTSLYVASLAWKAQVEKDFQTHQQLMRSIETLRRSIKGTEEAPIITRYVDEKDDALNQKTSKDVYTTFFFAYAVAYPVIKNEALKELMRNDLEKIGNRFLLDNLTIKKGNQIQVTLTPHYTEAEIRHGINKIFKNEKKRKKLIKGLKTAQTFFPFAELWPGLKKTRRAIKKKDADQLFSMVVPTMNGIADLAARAQDIMREKYREDLLPMRKYNPHHPGKRLVALVNESMKKLPPRERRAFRESKRFHVLSDLKILASNAMISLHLIKTAATITGKPQFKEYYDQNLFTQDALLQTALNWYGVEEEFTRLSSGNPAVNKMKKGYLSALSLYNLSTLESNPTIRGHYARLIEGWWKNDEHEDNPMARAFASITLESSEKKKTFPALIAKGLTLYPLNRKGLGIDFWRKKGKYLAQTIGGGYHKRISRDPIPISHRPKDSFLWQRNARRLKGDYLKTYPGTDYLFVYWLARAHGLIEAPDKELLIKK